MVALRRGDRAGDRGSRVVVLGEAKSGHEPRTTADLDRLRRIRELPAGRGIDVAHATLAVFGRNDFDSALRAAERADPHVPLVALEDMYA